jgi:hypothetical protein
MNATQQQAQAGSIEAHEHWIVVEDPRQKWCEGSLVNSERRRQLSAKGILLLPVCPEMFRSSGVGGYFRRSWGSGYPLPGNVPMYVCPVTLAMDATRTQRLDVGVAQVMVRVHWVARIAPLEGSSAGRLGQIRLASDSSQQLSRHAPAVPNKSTVIDLGQLGEPDKRGGWTVHGSMLATPPMPGHYGFGLFGMGAGFAVRWIAASATYESKLS